MTKEWAVCVCVVRFVGGTVLTAGANQGSVVYSGVPYVHHSYKISDPSYRPLLSTPPYQRPPCGQAETVLIAQW